ncbi:30S ribosomal protein S20 [Patescibacteria group bacterium]|nr:30S ribosomal protein S20 [Patescibacteria group bacterium]MBU1885623.1 30S ribosomal protein S20 [Patescibacteria group bacterium]
MPVLPHAKKALRASLRKAQYNKRVKSAAVTAMKKMRLKPTQDNLNIAYKAIDLAAKRNIFHANKAARLKSQHASLLKLLK